MNHYVMNCVQLCLKSISTCCALMSYWIILIDKESVDNNFIIRYARKLICPSTQSKSFSLSLDDHQMDFHWARILLIESPFDANVHVEAYFINCMALLSAETTTNEDFVSLQMNSNYSQQIDICLHVVKCDCCCCHIQRIHLNGVAPRLRLVGAHFKTIKRFCIQKISHTRRVISSISI